MANSTLLEDVKAAANGLLAMLSTSNKEVNELSRDTGWCEVTSQLINGWTADYVRIRRIRGRVFLKHRNLSGLNATNARMLNFSLTAGKGVGTGFSPVDVFESPLLRVGNEYPVTARMTASLSGGLQMATGLAALGVAAAREWDWDASTSSWPSPLPGKPTT